MQIWFNDFRDVAALGDAQHQLLAIRVRAVANGSTGHKSGTGRELAPGRKAETMGEKSSYGVGKYRELNQTRRHRNKRRKIRRK